MLVLTRKPGQAIIIGGQIELIVVEIKGDQVRLGISAPREIAVHRKEVYEQVRQENLQAAGADAETTEKIAEMLEPNDGKSAPKGKK